MEIGVIIFALVVIFIILTFNDIVDGEYSMIRYYLEFIAIFGSMVLGVIILFYIKYPYSFLGVLFFLFGLYIGMPGRNYLEEFLYNLVPPRYERMNVDMAINFLIKQNYSLDNIIFYLRDRRKLSDTDIIMLLSNHFSNEDLQEKFTR